MTIASPCSGICKLDEATGWCLGCGRSGDEIAEWGTLEDGTRRAVWEVIPDRLATLGTTCRRLPWTTHDIGRFVVSTLSAGEGTWVMGVVGAVAEFAAAPGEAVTVIENANEITAHTRNGAIRFMLGDDVRALTFDPPKMGFAPRIVLAVKRERGRMAVCDGVSDLGPDDGALMQEGARTLYDLGLARKEGRFCVRVEEGRAHQALSAVAGRSFNQALPVIAGPLIEESPSRVVESALGRVEVQGRIPPPDAVSPSGPHTHLLPDHIATGRAMPTGMDLPRAYLPGAIFYPPKGQSAAPGQAIA
ncbi:MAG: DUF1289 domain-containing protein [Shimia sp.]